MGTRKIDHRYLLAKKQARLLLEKADRAEGVLAGAVGGLGEAPKTREAWHELLDETLTRIAEQRAVAAAYRAAADRAAMSRARKPISHTEVTCQYCQAKIPLSWQQFSNFRKLVLWSGDENRDNDAANLDIPDWHDECRDYYIDEVEKDRR